MKPVFTAVLFGIFSTSAAVAGDVCMNGQELQSSLVDWYGEQPVDGQAADDTQLWASKDTGTWTVVKALSDGNACVIAQGNGWMGGTDGSQLLASLEN